MRDADLAAALNDADTHPIESSSVSERVCAYRYLARTAKVGSSLMNRW